jgi:CHAT domain-containing protein
LRQRLGGSVLHILHVLWRLLLQRLPGPWFIGPVRLGLGQFRRWIGLFLGGLLVCLGCSVALSQPANLSSLGSSTDLLQTGLERYQSGDLSGAIQQWQKLLDSRSAAQGSQPTTEQAIAAQKYLARAYQQVGQIDQAIGLFRQLASHYQQRANWQQAGYMLIEQAQLHSSLGQHRRAIELLCNRAPTINTSINPETRSLINPLDLTPRTAFNSDSTRNNLAQCAVDSAVTLVQRAQDQAGEAAALGSLGNAYRLQGDYVEAVLYLEQSLALGRKLHQTAHILSALNGLGNAFASLAKRSYRQLQYAQQAADNSEIRRFSQEAERYNRAAIRYVENSLALARAQDDTINQVRSLINLTGLYRQTGGAATPILQQAEQLWQRLPDSREKAFMAIRLASLGQLLQLPASAAMLDPSTRCVDHPDKPSKSQEVERLQQAIAIAQRIQDSQSAAFALGRLGHHYECLGNYSQALSLTQQAQLLSGLQENRYLWEWQAGRILEAQGKMDQAIAAYEASTQTLSNLRADLAISSRDFQFDFRDTVEPVYRELTALYLAKATGVNSTNTAVLQAKQLTNGNKTIAMATPVNAALKTIDSLRLAEVQNYLGEDCTLPLSPQPAAAITAKSAVISTIILNDQVAVILSLVNPAGQMQSQVHWIPVRSAEVTATINRLRLQLEKRSDRTQTYLSNAQKVYDWLIRPFAVTLQTASVETLVFIQDGNLRSIPMAALHDGQQFLVERYAIATTPSLALIQPSALNPASLRVLGFGLTQPSVVEGPLFFESLGFVQSELGLVQRIFPGSKGLVDQSFTRDRLQQELQQNNFPIVHLATHGKFGIDSRDTFLVTGKQSSSPTADNRTYNEKLTINQLYQILRDVRRDNPLELLTLTACETAVGSDRDALGIAGISLQAGARSAVASLWQVDDQSTAQLITQFYQNLRQGMSRAQALQLTQRTWLRDNPNSHPGYWAALILIGNWS